MKTTFILCLPAGAWVREEVARQIRRNRFRTYLLLAAYLLIGFGVGALVGYWTGGYGWAAVASLVLGIFSCFAATFGYFLGARAILRLEGARPAPAEDYPVLHEQVDRLSIAAKIPKPAIYVIDDPAPNAFATGRSPKHAAVAVTTGLIQQMAPDELEGVVAHELSHIRNRDTQFLLMIVMVINLFATLAGWSWRAALRAVSRSSGRGGLALLAVFVVPVLLSLVALVVGPLIQLAVSRSRESMADLSAVSLTGKATGLLAALKTLEVNESAPARAGHGTSCLYIDDPLEHFQRHLFHGLFDTHPPIEMRILALERVAGLPQTALEDHARLVATWRERKASKSEEDFKELSEGIAYAIAIFGGGVLTLVALAYGVLPQVFGTYWALLGLGLVSGHALKRMGWLSPDLLGRFALRRRSSPPEGSRILERVATALFSQATEYSPLRWSSRATGWALIAIIVVQLAGGLGGLIAAIQGVLWQVLAVYLALTAVGLAVAYVLSRLIAWLRERRSPFDEDQSSA